MLKFLILTGALLLACLPMNSQNKEFPNAIHAKINLVDYGGLYDGGIRMSQGFEVGYFRNIAPFLNLGVPVKMAIAKLPLETDNRVTNSFDLLFHLENIRAAAKISPYLFGGGGLFIEDFKKTDVHLPFGAGVNLRISKYAFINLQGEFRKAMADNRDNLQLGIGFVYLLHKSEIPTAPPTPLDTDKDSIPDLVDRCPDRPGPASALGCPDSDGDGLGDVEDECPSEAGPINGCPDRDRDGFADAKDECPDLAGRWNGCPDGDFDGVPDKDDDCPTDPGKPENRGCPQKKDADGDGFADAEDKCPDTAGTLQGCPDKDSDGTADGEDACPEVVGKLKGCPDSDDDGTADKDDPCPTAAGNFNGCPDSDGDGIADNLDKCPNSAGVAEQQGCPEIKKETREKLAFATKNIQFETNKAVLRMQSYAILDELFNILKQYPDYKLAISGHTDDVGDDATNLQLSSARAKACQDYLLFRGITPERLRVSGFGESRPIADNKNATGREMNRRVDFELVVE